MIEESIIDRLYEAALAPGMWVEALKAAAAASGSASASLIFYRALDVEPRFRATPRIHDGLARYVESGAWRHCAQARRAATAPWRGLLYSDEIMPPLGPNDSNLAYLLSIGLEAQLNGVVTLPTGEFCGVTFERDSGEGRHASEQVALLERLMPHVSRACLVATRLGLEAAQSSAHAFSLLGLPAAALRGGDVVLATNDLFERRDDLFASRGFGRLALREPSSNALFQSALAGLDARAAIAPRSIPVRSAIASNYAVIHILPMRRTAHEILSGADAMVVVTEARQLRAAPEPPILIALFDITASEARLCVELARGASVNTAAATVGVTVKTARTYIERIFAKTGVHSQAELIAMLHGAAVPGAP